MTNFDINKAYVGDTQVEKIYLGVDVVWSGGEPEPIYSATPLTFEIISGGTITYKGGALVQSIDKPIQYSINGGSWTTIQSTTAGTSINVNAGDKVRFKGENVSYSNGAVYAGFTVGTASFKIYGNIMSMIYGDNFEGQTSFSAGSSNNFVQFFNHAKVTDASNLILPVTTLTSSCYQGMFQGCTSLTTAPEIPATTLAENCYNSMFQGCTSLTAAPEIPATTLANNCCTSMFQGCTSLTTAPSILPAMTVAASCYTQMFQNCTSLTASPILPATAATKGCYYYMFSGCSSLSEVTCLATSLETGFFPATNNWLSGVAATGTFYKDPNMTKWTTSYYGIPSGWTVVDYVAPNP